MMGLSGRTVGDKIVKELGLKHVTDISMAMSVKGSMTLTVTMLMTKDEARKIGAIISKAGEEEA